MDLLSSNGQVSFIYDDFLIQQEHMLGTVSVGKSTV
jgi:hypothetical protein